MNIVLLDIDENKIYIYNKNGEKVFNINNFSKIKKCLGNDNFYYITDAMEANVNDLKELLNYDDNDNNNDKNEKVDLSDKLFIHPTVKGLLRISEKISFKGKHDGRLYDEQMKKFIEKTPKMKQSLDKGFLEIISYDEMKKYINEYKEVQKKVDERQKQKDKALDDILVDGSVKDIIDGKTDNIPDDVMQIDMENKGKSFKTEEQKLINSLNIKE
ncbi:hypothetical protein K9M42_03095 [Patescibacteria group bacterium]|nr:hypothetical protein [Patescibacteria group bacterium]